MYQWVGGWRSHGSSQYFNVQSSPVFLPFFWHQLDWDQFFRFSKNAWTMTGLVETGARGCPLQLDCSCDQFFSKTVSFYFIYYWFHSYVVLFKSQHANHIYLHMWLSCHTHSSLATTMQHNNKWPPTSLDHHYHIHHPNPSLSPQHANDDVHRHHPISLIANDHCQH